MGKKKRARKMRKPQQLQPCSREPMEEPMGWVIPSPEGSAGNGAVLDNERKIMSSPKNTEHGASPADCRRNAITVSTNTNERDTTIRDFHSNQYIYLDDFCGCSDGFVLDIDPPLLERECESANVIQPEEVADACSMVSSLSTVSFGGGGVGNGDFSVNRFSFVSNDNGNEEDEWEYVSGTPADVSIISFGSSFSYCPQDLPPHYARIIDLENV